MATAAAGPDRPHDRRAWRRCAQECQAVRQPLVADRRARRARSVGWCRSGTGSATVGGRWREGAEGQRWEGDYGDRRPRRWLNHAAPDLAPQRERLPELDPDLRPRLRAPVLVEHHTQHAVDAEPGAPEAGVGGVHCCGGGFLFLHFCDKKESTHSATLFLPPPPLLPPLTR